MKKVKGTKGITLVALVITVVVLLILAGVTIATLTGENGILKRAIEAKNNSEQATEKEKIQLAVSEAQMSDHGYQKLNQNSLQEAINNQFGGRNVVVSDNNDGTFTISCLDTLKDYIISNNTLDYELDWKEAMTNAKPDSSQEITDKDIMGIGTDGKSIEQVNMDLWEFTLLSNDTYALNDEEALNDTLKTPGYKFGDNGENIIDGKIKGVVPQYISENGGKSWKTVTNMTCTFCENNYLIYAPYIPQTVTIMKNTYIRANNLISVENFPSKLIDLGGAFKQTSIQVVPFLPNTIINLDQTFSMCLNLKYIENIPKNTVSMISTFDGCSILDNIDVFIPDTVTNMTRAFAGCNILSGIIKINANITDIDNASACLGNILPNNNELILLCSENIYNLFYDSTTTNHINKSIANMDSNIILKKMY